MSAPDTRTLARTLGGSTGLTDRWASHPFVLVDLPEWDVRGVWQDEHACVLSVALEVGVPDGGAHHQRVGLWGMGSPEATADLLARLAQAGELGEHVVSTGLPRGTLTILGDRCAGEDLPAILREREELSVSTWDFFATREVPVAQAGEEHVEALTGPSAATDVRACLDVANPLAEMSPEDPLTRWWGWRDHDGALRGVVGARQAAPGAPWSLGSIATDPAWRGHGIAAATTAVVTRAGLTESDWVTLGMYADNDAARRVYTRLGYAVVQEFESRR
ncbi:GNAT family N-acetyltransferase [Oerskovia sp. NPDC057915]|uniref:GNAT family N-acetyltransferase n=1 Tax=Oerskovia sp. NPDC057915 TaxID=3346280 RepID=UPI0036DC7242